VKDDERTFQTVALAILFTVVYIGVILAANYLKSKGWPL
jgi:hypothetical protein